MKCLHYISRILLERSICCTLKRIVKYVVVASERPEMAKETVTVRPDGHGWYISASLIEEFRRYDQGLSRSTPFKLALCLLPFFIGRWRLPFSIRHIYVIIIKFIRLIIGELTTRMRWRIRWRRRSELLKRGT